MSAVQPGYLDLKHCTLSKSNEIQNVKGVFYGVVSPREEEITLQIWTWKAVQVFLHIDFYETDYYRVFCLSNLLMNPFMHLFLHLPSSSLLKLMFTDSNVSHFRDSDATEAREHREAQSP